MRRNAKEVIPEKQFLRSNSGEVIRERQLKTGNA